jgi:hypothetical protein
MKRGVPGLDSHRRGHKFESCAAHFWFLETLDSRVFSEFFERRVPDFIGLPPRACPFCATFGTRGTLPMAAAKCSSVTCR